MVFCFCFFILRGRLGERIEDSQEDESKDKDGDVRDFFLGKLQL